MPDPTRKTRPASPAPGGGGDDSGPSEPRGNRPNPKDLLDRMKKVDPEQAKRYRQRTGQ
ncbi:MAG: ubiquitin-like protein UBact [Opitutales bacterium]